MSFRLGIRSEENLVGVHPDLVRCVRLAITTTPVDFMVHDGVRTIEEQREYVRAGVSKTLASKHLPQADSYGHAVDLVPYVNGKLRWEAAACLDIARAMRDASVRYQVPLTWGAVWDRRLSELSPLFLEDEIDEYRSRFRLANKRAPFLDYPHVELYSA